MPTYIYESIPADSSAEPERFELSHRMSDPVLTHHPETGQPIRLIITGGTGFISSRSTPQPAPASPRPAHTCGHGCKH